MMGKARVSPQLNADVLRRTAAGYLVVLVVPNATPLYGRLRAASRPNLGQMAATQRGKRVQAEVRQAARHQGRAAKALAERGVIVEHGRWNTRRLRRAQPDIRILDGDGLVSGYP